MKCLIGIARNWFEQLTKSALEKRLRKQFQDSFGLKSLATSFFILRVIMSDDLKVVHDEATM